MGCLIGDLNLNCIIAIDDLKDGHDIYCGTQKTVNTQGARKSFLQLAIRAS